MLRWYALKNAQILSAVGHNKNVRTITTATPAQKTLHSKEQTPGKWVMCTQLFAPKGKEREKILCKQKRKLILIIVIILTLESSLK